MSFRVGYGGHVVLKMSEEESTAVKIATNNLKRDFMRVLNAQVNAVNGMMCKTVYVKTAGVGDAITEEKDLPRTEDGSLRKEAYLILEKEGDLYILGSDRRGTIYGIYEFCQKVLGVSPWYFFADVPVKEKQEISLPTGYVNADYPTVEYRGIFINDEEELEHWCQRYMGEETIGVKTYEKIFELLLRLKLNYLWPAMHVNSFNLKRENGALANEMGIVIGTSHCDMLMRSNNREWKPWIKSKGYEGIEYDYSIPGRNREVLQEYWRESVEQNKDFEVSYTLGMRGIHDSGFEVRGLEGLTGDELLQGKIDLLTDVMKYQYEMLSDVLGRDTQKNFVPYKEVLELYDNGLEVPEDMTLIWVNDNYGYVRRYPGDKEKARKGGNGIYYHNSYWAPPGNSYLFICSIPLSHTRNELQKAYEEGIRKLWVTNLGAIKPLEQQLSYYAAFAWNVDKGCELVEKEELFLEQFINETFSGNLGAELAPVLLKFDQLTNVRKIEHMDSDIFSQQAYGDEGAGRLHEYEEMFATINRMHKGLPKQEKDAFFQMFGMKIHAAYYTYAMYYYADRSAIMIERGAYPAADKYAELCKEYDRARRSMLHYYNHVMSNGKWDGMVTPEDFPPPRTAMHPAAVPAIEKGNEKLICNIYGGMDNLTFVSGKTKWFELASGEGTMRYTIVAPVYLDLDCEGIKIIDGGIENYTYQLDVVGEARVLVKVDYDEVLEDTECVIAIESEYCEKKSIPVSIKPSYLGKTKISEDGRIVVEATDYKEIFVEGFKVIPNLGRGKGSLLEGRGLGACVSYEVELLEDATPVLELHRFPTLNSVGRIRIGVSVDGSAVIVLESEVNDEHKGCWKKNVQNNGEKLCMELPHMAKGVHTIIFTVMDKYVAFSRFVIYTKMRKAASLVYDFEEQSLPKEWDVTGFVKDFYGEESAKLLPRPVLYLPICWQGDSLGLQDTCIRPDRFGECVAPEHFLKQGEQMFAEEDGHITIDMASALAKTEYAYTKGDMWSYCNSPSYGESGLSMLIRGGGEILAPEDVQTLGYRIKTDGGKYRLWIRTFFWDRDASHFYFKIDGTTYERKQLYNGKDVWNYSGENAWKWIPILETRLEEGEHTIEVCVQSRGIRLEQMYITTGEELPLARG